MTRKGNLRLLFEEQFKKLGSIGREVWGTDRIKILDENGKEVKRGQVGELYSRTPHVFKEYWKDPEKTKSVFQGEWFSAGDMACQDEDGYFTLVDRKANMIITGGENVFPSEVENMLGSHPAVKYVAVIGIPDPKWGEAVKAIVTLNQGKTATDKELIDHCRGKIAGYKIPKSIDFIKDEEMPMTARRLPWGVGGAAAVQRKECMDCHTTFADRMRELKNVHPGIRDGKCEDCHLRHGIVPKLLLKKESAELCLRCHAPDAIGLDKPHVHTPLQGRKCTACHDPHGSPGSHLLKAEGAEACYTCHDSHGSEQDHLINFDVSVVAINPG